MTDHLWTSEPVQTGYRTEFGEEPNKTFLEFTAPNIQELVKRPLRIQILDASELTYLDRDAVYVHLLVAQVVTIGDRIYEYYVSKFFNPGIVEIITMYSVATLEAYNEVKNLPGTRVYRDPVLVMLFGDTEAADTSDKTEVEEPVSDIPEASPENPPFGWSRNIPSFMRRLKRRSADT